MKRARLLRVSIYLYLLLLFLAHMTGRVAQAVEKGTYQAPSLDGFQLYNSYDADGDEDGIKETHIKRYHNPKGDSIFSMTTQGRLWAWSLDRHGDNETDVSNNYVIRDSRCTGVFDEKYTLSEQFRVPECLKSKPATKAH